MKYAFFGTPHFVVHVLDALQVAELPPDLIVTQPDRPAGRGLLPRKSPVKEWAEKNNIPIAEPLALDPAFIASLKGFDLFVVAGYGKILPKELLAVPKHGTLNVHPSLLPLFRGPSPIESQILSDAKTVGVSVILLDEETDHGPVLAQKSFTPEAWPPMRSELEKLLWSEGGTLVAESLQPYVNGTRVPAEQEHDKATFTPKMSKEDGLIELTSNAYTNYLKYCAYEGWPGTYFFAERGGKKIRVKIAEASYENDTFKILRVIPEGKKETAFEDFRRQGS